MDSFMNCNKILELSTSVKYVSFDLFDTLVKRDVSKPTDIFNIVERISKIDDFAYNRIQAETNARSKLKKEEVTIDDIYSYLPYDKTLRGMLKENELSVESTFIHSNPRIFPIYKILLDRGIKLIIISDIYLPKVFVESILSKVGLNGFYKVYLSSEIGLKKSTGNLFKYVLKDLKIGKNEILHIGDSVTSDYLIPKRIGLKAKHIPRNNYQLTYWKQSRKNSLDYNIISEFINNSITPNNPNEALGFETLGPLLFGFCEWIHKTKIEKKIEKLFFLSRDGFLIYKAYKKLYPNEAIKYVYVSRRSLTVPLIHIQRNIEDVFSVIPTYLYTSVGTIIDRLGLNSSKYSSIIEKYGLSLETQMTKEEYLSNEKFLSFYRTVKEEIYNNSEEEFGNLIKYLDSIEFKGNVGIVDLGWYGTIQKSLEKIVDMCHLNASIIGLYIGISLKSENALGFVYSSRDSSKKLDLFCFKSLIELFLSANHGSLKKYIKNGGFNFSNFEYDINEKTRKDYETIVEIQKGAIGFIDSFINSGYSKVVKWDVDLSFNAISNLGIYPQKKDLFKLGDLSFYDTDMFYMAKPNFIKYRSIAKFIKYDLSPAPWKIGYLRRLLKIPLPYKLIYYLLRKIAKKE